MKAAILIFAVTATAWTSAALAYDDDMMGTMVNGRMTIRDERSDRVRDPEMDREEMIIDRQKRQGRPAVDAQGNEIPSKREPFSGSLPN